MRIASVLVGAVVAGLAGCGAGGDSSPGGSTVSAVPTAGQAEWLDPHNSVRAGAFGGVTVSPVPSPPLSALSWSTSAEVIAKAWAEGCVYQHNGGRSADGIQRGRTSPPRRQAVVPTPRPPTSSASGPGSGQTTTTRPTPVQPERSAATTRRWSLGAPPASAALEPGARPTRPLARAFPPGISSSATTSRPATTPARDLTELRHVRPLGTLSSGGER